MADAWVRAERKLWWGRRREVIRRKARSSWDAALFHHTAAAKALGGNDEATGTGALRVPRRRVTGSVLARFGGTSARLSEHGGVNAPARRQKPVRSRWRQSHEVRVPIFENKKSGLHASA